MNLIPGVIVAGPVVEDVKFRAGDGSFVMALRGEWAERHVVWWTIDNFGDSAGAHRYRGDGRGWSNGARAAGRRGAAWKRRVSLGASWLERDSAPPRGLAAAGSEWC